MDKVFDSGFEDSRLDSWLARSVVFLRRGSLYSRTQAIWFEMVPACVICYSSVLFVFSADVFVALFPTAT